MAERDIVVYDPDDPWDPHGPSRSRLDETADYALLEPMFDPQLGEWPLGWALWGWVQVAPGSFTAPHAPSTLYGFYSGSRTALVVVEEGSITRRVFVDGFVSIGAALDIDGDGIDEVVLISYDRAKLVRLEDGGAVTVADFGKVVDDHCVLESSPRDQRRTTVVVRARVGPSGVRFVSQSRTRECPLSPDFRSRDKQLRVW